jgi:carboxyl-terminal processing protease
MSGLGVYYPDGRETQRVGIDIDIEVKPTIEGIQKGEDELLNRALEFIRTGK